MFRAQSLSPSTHRCPFPARPVPSSVSLDQGRATQRQVRCKAEWLTLNGEANVPVPRAYAYELFSDKASIPLFMGWIKEVRVISDELSEWRLEQEAFGRAWTLTWLSKNLAPIKYRKIHWRSVPGSTAGAGGIEVENRGEVRFYKTSAESCRVQMVVQFEVPAPLAPFGQLLTPLASGIMQGDIENFSTYAQKKYQKALQSATV